MGRVKFWETTNQLCLALSDDDEQYEYDNEMLNSKPKLYI